MPPNTTSTSGLPADPAWNPIRRNISFISPPSPSPIRLRSKSTISATMSTAGGAVAEARTSTSMCRACWSFGLKMFGTPGNPHGLIAGRHCSRAVTCPPATPCSICASPAASPAMSVSVFRICTGLASADRTAAGKPGTPIASSSGCRSPASVTAARAHGGRVARETLDRGDERVEVGLQVAGEGVELVLGVLGDGLRAAVGCVGDLLGEPGLRVVERLAQSLRFGGQLGDGVEGVGHERRCLVEARHLEQLQQAEQAEQLGHRAGQERRRVERAGVERRRRVAAHPDRAERPGDALHGHVGRDEAAGPVGPLREVDGGGWALQRQDQLACVGCARHRVGIEGTRREPVVEIRLGVDEVDGGRLRREVPHRRHDTAGLGEERPRRDVGRVGLAVEDQVRDLDCRVTRP